MTQARSPYKIPPLSYTFLNCPYFTTHKYPSSRLLALKHCYIFNEESCLESNIAGKSSDNN